MDADTLRQDAHCLLLFVAAIALVAAGVQAASVAPSALQSLSFLDLGAFLSQIAGTVALTALALVIGLCAMFTAPRVVSGPEIVPDARWRRLWGHDM
jgi:hypothetical protein